MPEFDQLNRRSVVDDHGRAHPFRWPADLANERAVLDGCIEVIHLEGNVRDGPDEFGDGRGCIEAHPLYAIGARAEPRYMEAIVLEMDLSRTALGRGDAHVVVAPSVSRDRSRGLVVLAVTGHRLLETQ